MSAVTDEERMAFADGELPEARCDEIACLLETDAVLSARLTSLMGNDDLIRAAFGEISELPVPDKMRERIMSESLTSNVVSFAEARKASRRRPSYWATGLSMAASLAIGLIVGSQFLPQAGVAGNEGALVVASSGGPVASTQLASVLFKTPGGTVADLAGAGQARMSISFVDGDDRLCRQFSVEGQSAATDGAACLEDGEWRIEAVANRAIEGGEMRTASGDSAEAVLATVDMLIAGEPLDAAAEAQALKAAARYR